MINIFSFLTFFNMCKSTGLWLRPTWTRPAAGPMQFSPSYSLRGNTTTRQTSPRKRSKLTRNRIHIHKSVHLWHLRSSPPGVKRDFPLFFNWLILSVFYFWFVFFFLSAKLSFILWNSLMGQMFSGREKRWRCWQTVSFWWKIQDLI